jgi:voltage-gated potassium channel
VIVKFSKSYSSIIHTIEITLAFLFLFEFISRVDFADDRKAVVFNIYSIADLASIVPVLLILVFPDLAVVREAPTLKERTEGERVGWG